MLEIIIKLYNPATGNGFNYSTNLRKYSYNDEGKYGNLIFSPFKNSNKTIKYNSMGLI